MPGRAQHEVGERVVGDQRGHLARGDELADVLRLRLGERAGAPVGLVGRVAGRARAAPEAAVVAVRVDARAGQAERRLEAVAGLLAGDHAAVLAPVLVRVREDVDGLVVGAAAAAVAGAQQLAGLARGVEAVGVDDRHDDRARGLHQPLGLGVAAAVAEDQLVGPLHRVLGRRPLARVVRAHLEEDGLAVAGVRVRGDLDALDRTALVRGVVERDRLDEVGVLARQALHRLRVVEQPAVGGLAAGQLGGRVGGGEGRVGAAVLTALERQVRDLRHVLEARVAQLARVGRAVQHDLDEAGAAVLGHVEPRVRELLRPRTGRRGDPHQRRRLGGDRGQPLRRDRQVRAAGAAGHPARLHGQRARGGHVAGRDLAAAAVGRAGHEPAGQRVEHRQVPVTGTAVEPGGHGARAGRRHRPLDEAGTRGEPLGRAAAVDRGRRRDGRRLRGPREQPGPGYAERQRNDPPSKHVCTPPEVPRQALLPGWNALSPRNWRSAAGQTQTSSGVCWGRSASCRPGACSVGGLGGGSTDSAPGHLLCERTRSEYRAREIARGLRRRSRPGL